jgi:hypothetical protein
MVPHTGHRRLVARLFRFTPGKKASLNYMPTEESDVEILSVAVKIGAKI